jgi:hypothetical protein
VIFWYLPWPSQLAIGLISISVALFAGLPVALGILIGMLGASLLVTSYVAWQRSRQWSSANFYLPKEELEFTPVPNTHLFAIKFGFVFSLTGVLILYLSNALSSLSALKQFLVYTAVLLPLIWGIFEAVVFRNSYPRIVSNPNSLMIGNYVLKPEDIKAVRARVIDWKSPSYLVEIWLSDRNLHKKAVRNVRSLIWSYADVVLLTNWYDSPRNLMRDVLISRYDQNFKRGFLGHSHPTD